MQIYLAVVLVLLGLGSSTTLNNLTASGVEITNVVIVQIKLDNLPDKLTRTSLVRTPTSAFSIPKSDLTSLAKFHSSVHNLWSSTVSPEPSSSSYRSTGFTTPVWHKTMWNSSLYMNKMNPTSALNSLNPATVRGTIQFNGTVFPSGTFFPSAVSLTRTSSVSHLKIRRIFRVIALLLRALHVIY